jgi:hypothetical protein
VFWKGRTAESRLVLSRARQSKRNAGIPADFLIVCAELEVQPDSPMRNKFRTDLGVNVRRNVSESGRIIKSATYLQTITAEILKKDKPSISGITHKEADDVERLMAAILATVRTNLTDGAFLPREMKKSEAKQLDKVYKDLELKGRWNDHVSAANIDTSGGMVYIAEPYGLGTVEFADFVKLDKAGWNISVDERFATYFPGHAVCVLLRPPN